MWPQKNGEKWHLHVAGDIFKIHTFVHDTDLYNHVSGRITLPVNDASMSFPLHSLQGNKDGIWLLACWLSQCSHLGGGRFGPLWRVELDKENAKEWGEGDVENLDILDQMITKLASEPESSISKIQRKVGTRIDYLYIDFKDAPYISRTEFLRSALRRH